MRGLLAKLDLAPERWEDWNENVQAEMDRIQSALEQIAHSLEPHGQAGG